MTATAALDALLARAAGVPPGAAAPLRRAFLRASGRSARNAADGIETSIRLAPSGARGRRLLLEGVDATTLAELARLLARRPGPALRTVAEHAAQVGLPLLVGFESGGAAVVLKAYLNATERSEDERRRVVGRLLRALGARVPARGPAPHIVGVNDAGRGALELKYYVESARLVAPAADADGRAHALVDRLRAARRAAGALLVCDWIAERWEPRTFVAGVGGGRLATGVDPLVAALVAPLAVDGAAIARALPCRRSLLRFLGVALRGAPAYTAYFRPGLAGAAPPAARAVEGEAGLERRFRARGVEVAVTLTRHRDDLPAYATVRGVDLGYRALRGRASRARIAPLLAWVRERVATAGVAPGELARALGAAPPSPWERVSG